jgi:hypothetical protein
MLKLLLLPHILRGCFDGVLRNNISTPKTIKGDKMKSNKVTLLIAGLLFFATTAYSKQPPVDEAGDQALPTAVMPCPNPVHITESRKDKANPVMGDFLKPVPQLSGYNGVTANHQFWDTFTWKLPSKCCQFIKGTLTIWYTPITLGTSNTSSDAGNDKLYIYNNGTQVYWEFLYPNSPFPADGAERVKVITITPAMVTNNRLSFIVQDDTSIKGSKIDLYYCCLKGVDCN